MFAVKHRVRTQLAALALVPGATLLVIGLIVGAGQLRTAGQIRQWSEDLELIRPAASELVVAVTAEQLLSVQELTGTGPGPAGLSAARGRVDAGFTALIGADRLRHRPSSAIAAFWADYAPKLARARRAIDTGALPPAQAFAVFRAPLTLFDSGFRDAQRRAPDPDTAARVAQSRRLIDGVLSLSKSVTVAVGLAGSGGTAFGTAEFTAHQGHYRVTLSALAADLRGAEREALTTVLTGDAWRTLGERESALLTSLATDPSGRRSAPAEVDEWRTDSAAVLTGLMRAYAALHRSTAAEIDESVARETRRGVLIGASTTVLALGAAGVSLLLAARLGRRVGRLREWSLGIADHELPALLAAAGAGDPGPAHAVSAPQVGRDEIGEVAKAFEHAADAALGAAVAQLRLREGTRAVFVDMARRSQDTVHSQLRILDEAERDQQDPDVLATLFALDHLATRERRNAENLLILGGVRPGRQWSRPVALGEVVRSAIGESADYQRVRIGRTAEVAVPGAVVADLAHLLAELVDNATAFSPATTRVDVTSRVTGTGAVVEVSDQGIGMSPERLTECNAELANPPRFGVDILAEDSRLGLLVVAHLSAEHALSVRLHESPYGGVRAEVCLPATLLVTRS
ncbi:ATP-binding protein [Nocardia sp. NPDC056064]|uniref:sensor histidine kinase n=1 Tax=Nocardia sp. NPDC056064 TaxID=3345701 RepID=UPI0035D7E7B8